MQVMKFISVTILSLYNLVQYDNMFHYRYLVGEVFIDVDQDGAEQRLEKQKKEISKEVKSLEKQLEDVQKKMKKLKGELYAKFGNQINLEEK